MTDKHPPMDRAISEQFPYFNEEEQILLKKIIVASDKNDSNIEGPKKQFLDLIHRDLVNFYKWEATPDERIDIRKRLLNITSLFVVIPIEDLRKLATDAKLKLKKVVVEAPLNPIGTELCEMHSYDIKYIEGFEQVFSQIMLEPDVSALDYIAGNRERRQYPRTQFTVFRKNLRDEIISSEYLTGSAEPLTMTQMISLYDPSGQPRDLITIGFDLIYESAFIDFFHNAPEVTPMTLLRNAHILGKHFLLSAVNEWNRQKHKKDVLEAFPIFHFSAEPPEQAQVDNLFNFIKQNLVIEIQEKIKRWNAHLGLKSDDEDIEWPEKK